ncbi:MAG TPA: MliC family protein [Candidatus Acidoferrum sp.]|nr:MliC family protein [Candidatus Acidoferrum sp.]
MKKMLGQKASLTSLVAWASLGLLLTGLTATAQTPSNPGDPGKPVVTPGPANNVRPAVKWKRFDYTCEAGGKVTVYLHDTTAKVRTHDHIYMMRQASAADGNRYSDGKVLWWAKGDTGFLREDTPDGDGKMLMQGCSLDKPAPAPKP